MDPSQQSPSSTNDNFLPASNRPIFFKPSEFYSSSLSVIYEYEPDEEGNIVDESGNIVGTDVIYSRKPKVGDVKCVSMIRLDDYNDDSPGSQSVASFESEEIEENDINLESESFVPLAIPDNGKGDQRPNNDFDSSTSSTLTPMTDTSQDSQDSQTE